MIIVILDIFQLWLRAGYRHFWETYHWIIHKGMQKYKGNLNNNIKHAFFTVRLFINVKVTHEYNTNIK